MSGGRVWACLLCPEAEDGYAGFESTTARGFLGHMRSIHSMEKSEINTAKAEQQMHLCRGDGGSRSSANYRLPDGRMLCAVISWCSPEKRKPKKAKARVAP